MPFEKGNTKGVRFGRDVDPKEAGSKGGKATGKRLTTLINEMLEKKCVLPKYEGKTNAEALTTRLLEKALDDDKDTLNAIKEIIDRTEGKAQQNIDHTSNGETVNTPTTIKFDDE